MKITFSSLLLQLLVSSNETVRDLYRALSYSGNEISYPSLVSYKNFDAIPSFDRAKNILNYYNYLITDDDLVEILDYSRQELKEYRLDNAKYYQRGIRLSPSFFSEDLTVRGLEQLIEQRSVEVDSESGNINQYIARLIKDDLVKNAYLKEEK